MCWGPVLSVTWRPLFTVVTKIERSNEPSDLPLLLDSVDCPFSLRVDLFIWIVQPILTQTVLRRRGPLYSCVFRSVGLRTTPFDQFPGPFRRGCIHEWSFQKWLLPTNGLSVRTFCRTSFFLFWQHTPPHYTPGHIQSYPQSYPSLISCVKQDL